LQVVSRVTCLATGQQSGWADAAYGLHAGYAICERERTLGGETTRPPLALRILKSLTNQIKANQIKSIKYALESITPQCRTMVLIVLAVYLPK
jgi:hypothetical protein